MIYTKFNEGLEAILYIALNSGADPVSSKEICQNQNTLPRHMEPVLQMLVHAGILKGTKGPKGGYTLATEKRKLIIGDIFRLFIKFEYPKKDYEHSDLRRKIIDPLGDKVERDVLTSLDRLTLEDLYKKALEKDVADFGAEGIFEI